MWTRTSYFARETMVSLRRNVLMTVAGIATVAVSLSLFGGILMLSKWVDHGTEKLKGGVTLEIFMKVDATKQQIDDVEANLDDLMKPGGTVQSFRHLDKTDAYEEFKRIFRREPDLVSTISAEDLPESFRVAPRRTSGGPDIDRLTADLQQEFQSQQGVKSVSTPADALKGIVDVTGKVRWIFIFLSGILLLSSLFLIVNTIRLATFARRREIEVMKLVGASNWFVRVPFLAEGMVQGFVGAGIAIIAVVSLKHFGFDDAFSDPGQFFSEFFVTQGDTVRISLIVLAGGILIGTLGAVVGLRRFLRT
jgi:cell division transport system permease protein